MRIGICKWTTFPASFDDELAACRADAFPDSRRDVEPAELARRCRDNLEQVAL